MITWSFDGVLLHGPFPLRAYGLLLALAMVGAFLLWRSRVLRLGLSEAAAGAFLGWGLLGALVGARLAHACFYEPSRFLADPLELLLVWRGGLSSHGALAGLLLALALFARSHRFAFASLADPLSLGAALASVLVRVGNFCNSEVVGRPTGSLLGVRFPHHDALLPLQEVPARHPVQLYEAGLGLLVLGVLLLLERRRPRPGLLAAVFLALLFGGRIALESFKQAEGIGAGPLTVGQLLSLPAALAGLLWIALSRRRAGAVDRL